MIEPSWLGTRQRHRIICAEGHEWAVRPGFVSQGGGICGVCAGNDPRIAEARFRMLVEQAGGCVVEPVWLGALRPHRVICGEGHLSRPRPNGVQQGGGICTVCWGRSSEEAERQFRERVAALGGVLLEPTWLGKGRAHQARCAEGHACSPIPASVRVGHGICLICAGQDPQTTERRFRELVTEQGGMVLEPVWLGNGKPHRIRCARGHEATPMPASIQQGNGICRFCAGMEWDAFYVVTNPACHWLKFGITSGSGRVRLRRHRRAGFTVVDLLLTGLADVTAPTLEAEVKAALRLAGESPARGREYFDSSTLALVLDIAGAAQISPLNGDGAGGIVGYARPS